MAGGGLDEFVEILRAGVAIANEGEGVIERGVELGKLLDGGEEAEVVFAGLDGGDAEDIDGGGGKGGGVAMRPLPANSSGRRLVARAWGVMFWSRQ